MYSNPLNHVPNRPPPPPSNASGPYPQTAAAAAPIPGPYAPPAFDYQPVQTYEQQGGSYGLGIAVGFVFALLGLIIVYITGKPDTKRGALHGFLGRIALSILIFAFTGMFM
jgi:hypothetical protein